MDPALEVVLIRGFCTNPQQVYASLLAASTTSHTPQRVSVVSTPTPTFSGTSYASPFVTMPLSMFATQTFPRTDASGVPLRYYLTQCSLWVAGGTGATSGAPCLFDALTGTYQGTDLQATVRTLVKPDTASLAQCNMWWCGGEGGVHTTGLHWDAVHNILCVVSGRKRVLLLPPAAGPHLQESPLYAATPNHAQVPLWVAPYGGGTVSGMPPPSLPPGLSPGWCCDVTVEAGDALYIPEGWWHTVASEPGTLALNWWFNGEAQGGVKPWEERYHTRAGVLSRGREAMRLRNEGLKREAGLAAEAAAANDANQWGSTPTALANALRKGVVCDQALTFASQHKGLVLSALLELHPTALQTLLQSLLSSTVDIITQAWEKEEEEGEEEGKREGEEGGRQSQTRAKKFELLWGRAFPRDPESGANAFLARGKEEGLRVWLERAGEK